MPTHHPHAPPYPRAPPYHTAGQTPAIPAPEICPEMSLAPCPTLVGRSDWAAVTVFYSIFTDYSPPETLRASVAALCGC